MFIDKKDIKKYHFGEVIDLDVLIKNIGELVLEMVDDKLAFVPEYEYGKKVMREDAEELLFEIYKLLKRK
jgi:hypothetical protein